MRNALEALPRLALIAAMATLAACGGGGTRAPSAPPVSPAPTPTPTASSLDVLPCLNQTLNGIDRVPQGTRVLDLVIPDTLTIYPDRTMGFPNGRLLTDPVVDITLAAILIDINRPGQNVASIAAIPLNAPRATKPPIADFPFAPLPNGNPTLDPGTGTGFVFDDAPLSAYVQVDRMGMPAVATALVLSPRKDAYNDANVLADSASQFSFDLIEGLRRFAEPLQDDLQARGLVSCAVRR